MIYGFPFISFAPCAKVQAALADLLRPSRVDAYAGLAWTVARADHVRLLDLRGDARGSQPEVTESARACSYF